MDSPPPFGDPTNVQRENNAAVAKGFAIGCGGCAAMICVGIAFIAAIFIFILSMLRSDVPSQNSLTAAQSSEVVRRELGEPITMGWFVTGSILTEDGVGVSDVSVPISGPRGAATVHAIGRKKSGGPWVYSEMTATIEKTGEAVDLRKP